MPNQTSEDDTDNTANISFYAFLLLTFVLIGRPQEIYPPLQQIRPILVLTIINVVLVFLQKRNPISICLKESLGKKYLAFYGMMLIGIPFAYHRRVAFEFAILQYSINILYFGLFIIHIDSYKRMRALVLTIVYSILLYGGASLRLGGSEGGRYSFGTTYDPNDLAYLLVSLLPFTALFFSKTEKYYIRIIAVTTMIISLVLVFLTGSRGGVIGVIVFLILFLFTKLSPVKRPIKIVFFIVLMVIALVNKDMIFTERNVSILEIGQDYNVTDEFGRFQLWKKGLEFTLERPLTGVGAQCFQEAIGRDRKERNVQERWQVVHNAYLQVSSDLGMIAFIIFLLMIKESLQVFHRIRIFNGTRPNVQKLAGVTQIAFICHLVVAFFLTQGYSILFTLYFALASVILMIEEHNKILIPLEHS